MAKQSKDHVMVKVFFGWLEDGYIYMSFRIKHEKPTVRCVDDRSLGDSERAGRNFNLALTQHLTANSVSNNVEVTVDPCVSDSLDDFLDFGWKSAKDPRIQLQNMINAAQALGERGQQ